MSGKPRVPLLDIAIDAVTPQQAVAHIARWAQQGQSRYVCVANVHMVMEAHDRVEVRRAVQEADLVVPDGMPLVWWLRLMGLRQQPRVYGPDLMLRVCAWAAQAGVPIGLYGAQPQTLRALHARLQERFPRLSIAYQYSPPFRPLSAEEDRGVVEAIRRSGARVLFVALGCPKQELWMAAHRGRVPAVMLGVGAAFDFLAEMKPQAPRWMRHWGLEWLFRLLTEPRRLWRRYLYHNPRFLWLAGRQWLAQRLFRG